jgi:penicillin-insensitive murein endopeptidase
MRRWLIIIVAAALGALLSHGAAARPREVPRNVSRPSDKETEPAPPPDRGRATERPGPKSEQRKTRAEIEAERYRGPGARPLPRSSRSIGLPFRGRLRDGVRLRENAFLRFTGEHASSDNVYGTWELVQLLERAAFRVHQRAPGSRLSVGELSAPRGGDIPGHSSHENGRDADVSFYMLDGRGRPVEPYGFAEFGADGVGRGANAGLRFDDARNYELVAKLVTDGDARVQYVFVGRAIKRRLLAEAARRRAPRVILERMDQVLVEPAGGHPHENHFHVRIYCAPSDRPACEDRAPFHAWYPGRPPNAPAALAVAPEQG